MKRKILSKSTLLFLVFNVYYIYAQNFVDPPVRIYNGTVRGDMNIIGNNIINRDIASGINAGTPNQPYQGQLLNDGTNLQFIDVDGDANTFNSSSATLTLPTSCSKIIFAALYWGGVYNKNNRINGQPINRANLDDVRLTLPGGGTTPITGTIIHDTYANASSLAEATFYGAWADITAQLQALPNANGVYTVANVTTGTSIISADGTITQAINGRGGYSAGWSLYVVYEDVTQVFRNISAFNGATRVNSSGADIDITVNGFNTIPVGPVRAKVAFISLEGDYTLLGDRMTVNGGDLFLSAPNPVRGGTATRPSSNTSANSNFFNATINDLNGVNTNRTPNSDNTFGWDTGIIEFANTPNNAFIPNNATSANIRISTAQDAFFYTFTAFSIDVINPNIQLTQTALNNANQPVTADLALGETYKYRLCFKNIGNDNAINYTITDVLPANVDFISTTYPVGITHVFNPATNTVVYTIPNALVPKLETAEDCIILNVRVLSECNKFRDACSDLLINLVTQTYTGQTSGQVFNNLGSTVSFDACGFPQNGNIQSLGDRSGCNFIDRFTKCSSDDVTITGPNGYETYEWTLGGSPIGTTTENFITIGDALLSTVPGPPWTVNLTAFTPPTDPCKDIDVTIIIDQFDPTQNPLVDIDDQTVNCPSNGEQLSRFYLCGANDQQVISINVSSATEIKWYRIDNCTNPLGIQCPFNDGTIAGCTLTEVGSGLTYTATTEGRYQLFIRYQNGCQGKYYFDVYKNLFSATERHEDIICNTPGSIIIDGVPTNYLYAFVPCNSPIPAVGSPLFQPLNTFTTTTPGCYDVYIIQNDPGLVNPCIFSILDIPIIQRNVVVTETVTNPLCHNTTGSIRVQVADAEPQYSFELVTSPGGVSLGTSGLINLNDYTFPSVPAGDYTIRVRTTDGCSFDRNVTVVAPRELTASVDVLKPLTCTPAVVQINVNGGTPNYNVLFNNTSTSLTVIVSNPGTYPITVVDANSCTFNLTVTILPYTPPVYTVVANNTLCSGQNNGTATVNVTNNNGYVMNFAISNPPAPPTDPNDLILYHDNIVYGSANTFTNLAPGTYYVNIRWNVPNLVNLTYCYEDVPITITNPNPISGNIALTPRTTCVDTQQICANGATTGGVPPYEYSLNGSGPYQTAICFPTVGPGTHYITIRDANLCTFNTPTVTINPIVRITDINFAFTPASCNSPTTLVTPTAVGGNGAVTFVANPGNITLPGNLGVGSYDVTATDALGCTYTENFVINPIVRIGVTNIVNNDVGCFGTASGQATATVSNFSTNYNYNLTGPTPLTGTNVTIATLTLPNLLSGNYTLTVTDNATGCTANTTFTIAQPTAPLAVTPPNIIPIKCTIPQASVTINATGGWGNNTYSVTAPNGVITTQNNNPVFLLTQVGNYTYTVTDTNLCQVNGTFTLTTPTIPTLAITASDYCYDANQASITVVGSGGSGMGYQYTISLNNTVTPGDFGSNTTGVFNNLIPGTFYFFVMDSNFCISAPQQVTINRQILATAKITKGLDCTTTPSTASITVDITDGYPNYTYRVSFNGAPFAGAGLPVTGNSFVFTTTNAGTYRFEVTDSRGCIALTNIITIAPIVPLTLNVTLGPPIRCAGTATGSIIVTPGGGSPAYDIKVVKLPSTVNLTTTGLTAGTYTVTVTDALTCSISQTITITEPPAVNNTINLTPLACAAGGTVPGAIEVTGVMGVAPFTYILSGGNIPPLMPLSFSATTGQNYTFTGLGYGNYTLVVRDANGCEKVTSPIAISSPITDLIVDATSPVASCTLGATINVTTQFLVTGTPNLQYAIYTGTIAGSTFLPVGGTSMLTWTFSGLIPNSPYVIVVRDLNTGCVYFKDVRTGQLPGLNLATTPVPTNITCNGAANGCISATVTGITPGATQLSYEVVNFFNQPLMPAVTGTIAVATLIGNGGVTPCVGNLPPGQYFIRIREVDGPNAGCGTTSLAVEIRQSATPPVVGVIVAKNDNCKPNEGQIFATGSGGTPFTTIPSGYEFLLVPSTVVGPPTAATWGTGVYNNVNSTGVYNVEGGNYVVYMRDQYGCIVSAPVTVPTDPTLVFTAVQNPATLCNGIEGNYEITVTLTAGIGPFTYFLDGATGGTQVVPNPTIFPANFNITGLNSGPHTIRIVDKNGCDSTVNLNILPPLDVSAIITLQPNPLCNIDVATITATAIGGSGTGNYQYTIAPYTSSGPATNTTGIFQNVDASATPYTITVRDIVTNCTDVVQVTVPLAVPVTVTLGDLVITGAKCNGGTDGSVRVNLPLSNTQGPYTFQVLLGAIPVQTNSTGVFTNLTPNAYQLTVISSRNCFATVPFTISNPPQLIASGTATPPQCNNTNTPQPAVITINVIGGTPQYGYSITGTPGSYVSSNIINEIRSGLLTYYVIDQNGCTTTTQVNVPALPVMNPPVVTLTDPYSCSQPGELTISVTGGSGSYTYTLLNTNQSTTAPTAIFTVSASGTYNFLVTDLVTTCTRTAEYTVPPNVISTAVATTTRNIACFGDMNGEISINVQNYTGNYTYTVLNNGVAIPTLTNQSANTTTNPLVISNLGVGNYTVSFIKDQSALPDCTFISNVTSITAPNSPVNGTYFKTDVTCRIPSEGSISVNASGGTGTGYVVAFFQGAGPTGGTPIPTNPASPYTAQNLGAGDYYYTVTDSNNCVYTSPTIPLALPLPITATLTSDINMLLCKSDVTATITCTITPPPGGFGSNYTFTLFQTDPNYPISLGGDTNTTGIFTPKGAGSYFVLINDAWGCTYITNVIFITEPPTDVTATILQSTPLTCPNSANNAQLTLNAVGGTPPYYYSNTNPNVTSTTGILFTPPINVMVGPGTYTYYVTDANNCVIAKTNTIKIDPIPDVVVTIKQIQNVLCFGDNTGKVVVTAVGGIINTANPLQTYTYELLQGGAVIATNTTGEFTGLTAGNNYSVVASTIGTCRSAPVPFRITEPNQLVVPPIPDIYTSCANTADACVRVFPTGGTPFSDPNVNGGTPYYQYRIDPPNDTVYLGNNEFCGLAPGTYTIRVSDNNNCFTQVTVNVIAPSQIVISTTTPSPLTEVCFGDTVTFNGTVAGGREANPALPYIIEIRDFNDNLVDTTTSITGAFTFPNLTSLGSPYNVIAYIQGTPTCRAIYPLIVNPGVIFDIRPDLNMDCSLPPNKVPVQTMTINVLLNSNFNVADLTYSYDGGPFGVNNVFSNAPGSNPLMTAGPHTVVVQHINGCLSAPINFEIESFAPLTLTLTPVGLNQFSAITTGGSPDYTYTVQFNGTTVTYDFSQNYFVTQSGTYFVTVTDANGCTVTQQITIEYIPIYIPNYFTPNGSGTNDTWSPWFIDNYPDAVFEIYDRYGRRLRILTYQESWDGKYEGNPMPSGDYWYILKLNRTDDSREFVGNFTLYR